MENSNLKHLSEMLSPNEMSELSSHLMTKLEAHFQSKQLTIENLKLEITNSKDSAEHNTFVNSREIQKLQSKLEMADDFCGNLKRQLKDTEAALQLSRHEYYETLQCKESLTFELQSAKEKCQRQCQEKLDMSDLLIKRESQLSHLKAENDILMKQLENLREGKLENCIKYEEMQLKQLTIKHEEIRMKLLKDLFQKQTDSLNEELNQKISELSSVRRERAMQLFDIESNLKQKMEELNRSYDEVRHLKGVVEKKDKHIESLANRIRELQNYNTRMECDFQNEISALNKLLEIHKETNGDLKKRNDQLLQTIEEMQKLLMAAKEAHNDIEEAYRCYQSKCTEQYKSNFEIIESLKKQLKESKETVQNLKHENLQKEIEMPYPIAAATNKMMRQNINMNQMYSNFIDTQNELKNAEKEISQLKSQIQLLTLEYEENAPLLQRKVHEHQRSLQTIAELRCELSTIVTERELLFEEKDKLIRLNNHSEREIKRLERENCDLSLQIRRLLQSVHEARGFPIVHSQDRVSSSTDYGPLSPQMITFRDIEQLQTKNQELLSKVHLLTDKINELESQENETDNKFRMNLDNALQKIEELRTERHQHSEMIETLINQRDSLLSQANDLQQRSPAGLTSTPLKSTEDATEMKGLIEKITSEFEKFRDDSDRRIKEYLDQNETLRQELANSKIEATKASSELIYTQEKVQIFHTNMEQFQKENGVLRDANTNLRENVKFNERQLLLLKQDLSSLQDNVKRLEIANENLKAERDSAKNNEIVLTQEKEIMIRDHENQSKLMNAWKSFQTNLEKMESETMKGLRSQIENLEKECRVLKNKYEKEQKLHNEAIGLLERHSHDSQEKIDREVEKYLNLQQELAGIHAKVHSTSISPIHTEIYCLTEDINKMRSDYDKQLNSLRNMKEELQIVKGECESKSDELKKLNEEIELTQEQNSAAQKTIVQLRKVARKYKTNYDEIKGEYDQNKALLQEYHEKESNNSLVNTSVDITDASVVNREDIRKEFEIKLNEANQRIKELEQKVNDLSGELSKINEEKDAAKAQAIDKENKAKNIAVQAKKRIEGLMREKDNLGKEKDDISRHVNELSEKIAILEQNSEESSLRLDTMRSQYEGKMNRLNKEITDAHKLNEELKAKLLVQQQIQVQPSQQIQQPTPPVTVTAPAIPVRHSVHPQQQIVSAKPTPMASIRPVLVIGVNPVAPRTARTAATQSRTATIATVQPTTDEIASHQNVPQATVQPTQTAPTMVVVAPTATSDESTEIPMVQSDNIEDNQNNSSTASSSALQINEENVDQYDSGTYLEETPNESRENQPIASSSSLLPSIETISPEKILTAIAKRARHSSGESSLTSSPKRACIVESPEKKMQMIETDENDSEPTSVTSPHHVDTEVIESQSSQVSDHNEVTEVKHEQQKFQSYDDDDDVIVLESDSEQEYQEQEQEMQSEGNEDEDYGEEEDPDEENDDHDDHDDHDEAEDEENVEDESEYEEQEDYSESLEGVNYEENRGESSEMDNDQSEGVEIIGLEDNAGEPIAQDESSQQIPTVPQQHDIHEASNDQIVLDNSGIVQNIEGPPLGSSLLTTMNQPFAQIPTPIQRGLARQSFYLSHHAQQSNTYEEGDGIVPSTPTLFVPRHGFAESLNSPRVPQSRFVFSSSIPESSGLSQLASEGTLGVDDTRMDLSQFDDNNNDGRSVPNTPFPVSPAVESETINTEVVECSDSTQSDLPATSVVTNVGTAETANLEKNIIELQPMQSGFEQDNDDIVTVEHVDADVNPQNEMEDNDVSETMTVKSIESSQQYIETNEGIESDRNQSETTTESTLEPQQILVTASLNQPRQIARRGRGFRPQNRGEQRRPIVWTDPSIVSESVPSTTMPTQNQPQQFQPQQFQPQQEVQQPASAVPPNRRIRLRGNSKFSRRGFRGGPSGHNPRGGY